MPYRPLLIVCGLVFVVYGVGLLAMPLEFAGIDGYVLDDPGEAFARLWGGVAVGLGWLCLLARSFDWTQARRSVTFSLFVTNGLLFAVYLFNQLTGMANPLGWGHVVLHLLLAVNALSVYWLLWKQY